jgi:hypothetical protein
MKIRASLPRLLQEIRTSVVLSIRIHSWLNQNLMEIKKLDEAPPFITKDGSEIRELLAYRNSAIRRPR